MIPAVLFSKEALEAIAQAYQGPQKPPVMWKRVCAFSIRAVCHVLASPAYVLFGVVALVGWAFLLEDD